MKGDERSSWTLIASHIILKDEIDELDLSILLVTRTVQINKHYLS